MSSIYVIGSLRNENIPQVAEQLRQVGHDVFDDWHSAGKDADDYWRDYEIARGHNYQQALDGYAAQHVFDFDKTHLDRCDIGVLVYPAGKSAHLELGYMIGAGKVGYILMDGEPERYDVMTKFAKKVCISMEELVEELELRPSHVT